MTIDKGRIAELLGTGLSNDTVAAAVGCTLGYIANLMSESTFADQVLELRSVALTANSKRDRAIDGIEDTLLSKLKEAIEADLIYKPGDILRSFAVVNSAKRRGIAAHENLTINQTVVNLQVPRAVVKQFTINQQGEVVDVEDGNGERKTLVTMPAHTLLKTLAANKRESDPDAADRYERVGRYLPAQQAIAGGAGPRAGLGEKSNGDF